MIEAVPETLELKRKVYAATEPKMRPDAILATNTSSIPLEQLRTGLQRPGAAGRHPFLQSGVAHAAGRGGEPRPGFGRRAGEGARLPRPHRSPAGAGEERAGIPGQPRTHAVHARSHGDARSRASKRETIDAAAENFGMPMGPIELADQVGLDICLHVAETLKGSLDAADARRLALAARTRSSWASSAARPARASMNGRTAKR